MAYLDSGQSWPRHPRPQARAALEEARAAGWWFKPSGKGHAFGRLRCLHPESDSENDACKVAVYSTSGTEDGSDTARVVRDALRKCSHERSPATGVTTDCETAARLGSGVLAQVVPLLAAGEGLLANQRALAAADDLVEMALRRLSDYPGMVVNDLDEQAAELERLAVVEERNAYASAARAGAADPWPPGDGAREVLELARHRLEAAVPLVTAAVGSSDQTRLERELERLQVRLEGLRAQLEDPRDG